MKEKMDGVADNLLDTLFNNIWVNKDVWNSE